MLDALFVLSGSEDAREIEIVIPVVGRRKVTAREVAELFELRDQINRYEDEIRTHWAGSSLSCRMSSVVDHFRVLAVNQLRRTKQFRDDMLVWLRAMAINADSVSRAATHGEKNARLRGLVDVIEGAVSGLRKETFEVQWACWEPFQDVFRSDYPTRELLQKIRELEATIKEMSNGTANEEG